MKTIGITGANGFVGTHLRFLLHEHKDIYNFISIDKEDFNHKESLDKKISQCDVLVHLAALNRGDEEVVYNTNIGLTRAILTSCDALKHTPHIIFLSSTHNTRNTAYGRSKKESEVLFSEWAQTHNTPVSILIAPNIFGEFLKPYHNSFVGTFCSELSQYKESRVDTEAKVELVYVRDICMSIYNCLKESQGTIRVSGEVMSVSGVYEKLKRFRDEYKNGVIPSLITEYDRALFNTFRSVLYPDYFPMTIDVKSDNRGFLVEIVKEHTGGQTFFSQTNPGISRGNHYHTRKIERFCVIQGDALIKLRRLFSDIIIEYKVSGSTPVYIDMPTYYTHSIENIGTEQLLTVFWTNEIFNPLDPDTYMEPVSI